MPLFAVSTKYFGVLWSPLEYFVDTANRGMPSLCMQAVGCRFSTNGSNKGVSSFYTCTGIPDTYLANVRAKAGTDSNQSINQSH